MRKENKRIVVGGASDSASTIFNVFNVARNRYQVELDPECLRLVDEVNLLYTALRREKIIYGDSTGFGERDDHYASPDQDKEKNRNLVYSLNCGSGDFLRRDQARAAMFARILVLSKAHSGVRPAIIACLADMLNQNKIPKVPSLGSIGASGDLIPSSYVAMEVLKQMDLEGREGLAMLNGTHFMSGISALVLMDFAYLCQVLCDLFAVLFQCLGGVENVFDRELHNIKAHKEEREVAGTFRELLWGSRLLRNIEEFAGLKIDELKTMRPIQDRYSLRCLPQAIGPVLHRLNDAFKIVENELNSVSDNPVIVDGEIKHGGHFDGSHVAEAMNCLKLSIREMAYIARAYARNVTDTKLNHGLLPTYLVESDDGIQNGLQGVAGLSIDAVFGVLNKEAIADSLFTMNDHEGANQDIVSFGMHSALSASRMVKQLATITAVLAIVTRQAVGMLKIENDLSPATKAVYENLTLRVPFIDKDRSLDGLLRFLEKLFFEHKF